MDRKELSKLGLMRAAANGVVVFDALYIDNGIMTSELVKREFMLEPGQDRQNWVFHSVHVAATRSISQRRLVKYEFISGNVWMMQFDGRLGRDGALDSRRSRIAFICDHGGDRQDKGQQARVELNKWLTEALGDNETQ